MTIGYGQSGVGRNDKDVVWFHRNTIFSGFNRHLRMGAEQFHEQTFVLRCKVLDHYERHAAVGRHVCKK